MSNQVEDLDESAIFILNTGFSDIVAKEGMYEDLAGRIGMFRDLIRSR